jgi:ubiquinone biosynthesis protein
VNVQHNLRRLCHVFLVVIRHALIHMASRMLSRWPRLERRVGGPSVSGPERFKKMIEDAGGTFIKFGQVLALQSDLLPLEYCRVLFTLFENVEPFAYEQVEQAFLEDFKRTPAQIFDFFDVQPIATGSIGQVHAAILRGAKVAVKVRRPSIVNDFRTDLTVMKAVVRVVKLLRIRALHWIVAPLEEFIAWSQEELDFRHEGHYMEELGRNARDNALEKVPRVYWSCTTARILTTEFLAGTTVSAYLRKREAGQSLNVFEGFNNRTFSANLIDNFLGDAFRHGMFHADLHPGNLVIMQGNVVGYVDFGISGVLSRYSRRHLIAMTLAYARGDLDAMCESFFRITTFDQNASLTEFRRRLREVSAGWYGAQETRSRLRKSITSIMLDLLMLSRENGIWPQRDVIKYIRSAIALDGLVKTFTPGMDIGRHLEQACERHIKWDSMRNLVSRDTVAGWFGGYANLVRNGALRAVTALRRLNTEETSFPFPPAKRKKKGRSFSTSSMLQWLWVGICGAVILKPAPQMLASEAFHLTLPLVGVAVFLVVWRKLKHAQAG